MAYRLWPQKAVLVPRVKAWYTSVCDTGSCKVVAMIRLGVAVKIVGQPGLRARDGRRAASSPHLSVSLLLLRDVLLYLAGQHIRYYRLADDLAPFLTHPELPQFHGQIEECGSLLAEVGGLARAHGLRLTIHPGLHVALSAPDETVAARAAHELGALSRLLDGLQAGPDGVLVLHVGGAHGDRAAALERFAARFERLPAPVRARVAVEPDEHCFDLVALLRLHQLTGVPLVFDALHFQLNNPQHIALPEALALALATWPRHVPAEVHFSTQRTEGHLQAERGGGVRVLPPRHGQHADFVNPFEFAALVRAARGLPSFDVLLEAKAGDMAVLRLREDLQRFASDVAALVS